MKIHFLLGLPRAGNTLFGSLMNQNHNVKVTANSIIPVLLYNILDTKNHGTYENFPDPRGIDGVVKNLFSNYYEHLNVDNVIDRGAWGLPFLSDILKKLFSDRRYIILYRPILECLASFVRIDKPKDVRKYCDEHMTNSIISQSLRSTQNIYNSNENFMIVHYDDFCKDPISHLKDVCNFLDIPYVEPDLTNIKQFDIDGYKYIVNTFHSIRTNDIKRSELHVEDYLPIDVIDKYKDYEVKRND
jgi:hypothetical protein